MTGTQSLTIEPLVFDSRMLGLACGKIHMDIQAGERRDWAADQVAALLDENRDFDLVLIKTPGEYPGLAGRLIHRGAALIDTELTFTYKGPRIASPDDGIIWADEWPEDDFTALAQDMTHSRFLADPLIPREKALGLWRESIRNHCRGRSEILAVARREGRPAGMIAFVPQPPDSLNLFLVGVLPPFQGQGIGQRLVKSAVWKFHPERRLKVEALAGNTRARHCYQQAGFHLDALHYILHFWKKSAFKPC